MWDRKSLKERGKKAFKKNYWSCVIVAVILSILTAAESINVRGNSTTDTTASFQQVQQQFGLSTGSLIAIIAGIFSITFIIALLLEIFVRNMLLVGGYRFFINNNRYKKAHVGDILSAYKEGHFLNIFLTMFLEDIFLFLWTLLFIIPGIVKAYSYRMVPYILAEDSSISPTEAITMSRNMMNGHKWNAFVLDLSFIGWILLSVITFGIVGIFYYCPYKEATNAALYDALKKAY